MSAKTAIKGIIISAIFLSAFVTACVKTTSTPSLSPTTSTVGQIISQATNLTIFDSALSKAGLLVYLDSTNSVAAPYTVFAPVNLAFTSAGFTDSTVYYYSKDSLRNFLGYYIIAGDAWTLGAGSFPVGPDAPLQTIFGDTIFCSVIGGNLYINGNLISQPDIIANNGVIQALSGIYYPPAGNLISVIQRDTTLSFLDTAILGASLGDTNFISMLSSGVYTIFAPTNNAFRSAGYATSTQVYGTSPDSLARLLTTHILAGRVFSSDFTTIDTVYSISNDSLFVSNITGLTVQSKGDEEDSTTAYVGPQNIMATNGLIQKVSVVLFPYYPF